MGHENLEIKRYILLVVVIAFLLSLYGNSLLSNITVVPAPEGLKTIKELFDSGFKIFFLGELAGLTVKEIFEFEFKLHNLLEYLQGGFYPVNATNIRDLVPLMAERSKKLAMPYAAADADLVLRDLTNKLRLIDPTFFCFKLHQTMLPKMLTWKIHTENIFWVKKTLRKLVESGLFSQWDKWSTWRHFLTLKLLEVSTDNFQDPDYIDFGRFCAMMSFWLGMLILSLIVFFCETFWESNSGFGVSNENKNVNGVHVGSSMQIIACSRTNSK
ncbi:unnamed protein product [Orchesella dallaii]|uniref:Uncharacterized protein n=1 Tax=Orchesella dallaii TaxID=48710 RepID=A0ABP1R6J0_9HEXA